ncbi:ETEC_3214 domain-containing protein [Photobacterium sp. DNB22_13_2]
MTTLMVKTKSIIFSIAAVIISIGGWNDTEAVLVNTYQKIKANFTHENEYRLISQLTVGHSFDYVKQTAGLPQAVKASSLDDGVQFNYFNYGKFLLSIAVKDNRVAAYSIQALQDDFMAQIPYTEHNLYSSPLDMIIRQADENFFESGSVNFYLDAIELGRDALFHQLMVGMYNYTNKNELQSSSIANLDDAYLFEDKQKINSNLEQIRSSQVNTFSVSELSRDVVLEMMLTKFEYTSYFS